MSAVRWELVLLSNATSSLALPRVSTPSWWQFNCCCHKRSMSHLSSSMLQQWQALMMSRKGSITTLNQWLLQCPGQINSSFMVISMQVLTRIHFLGRSIWDKQNRQLQHQWPFAAGNLCCAWAFHLQLLLIPPNCSKMSWMHPHSKPWHLLNCIIVKQRDEHDISITISMHGADCLNDHRLIVSKLNIKIQPPRLPQGTKTPKQLNVYRIKSAIVNQSLAGELDSKVECLSPGSNDVESD